MINVHDYLVRMHWFQVHMDLLHEALGNFSQNRDAWRNFVTKQERKISVGPDGRRTIVDDLIVREYGSSLSKQVQTHVEFSESKLHQSEIILRCAFFEEEMKDIHRHCLCAKPELLRADKEIPLGRLVTKGEEVVVNEEIDAEVERLDRQNVKEKAKYFRERLGLHWGDPGVPDFDLDMPPVPHEASVEAIHKTSELRNRIVHQETDYVVKVDELNSARLWLSSVPLVCSKQAVKLYPTHFSDS